MRIVLLLITAMLCIYALPLHLEKRGFFTSLKEGTVAGLKAFGNSIKNTARAVAHPRQSWNAGKKALFTKDGRRATAYGVKNTVKNLFKKSGPNMRAQSIGKGVGFTAGMFSSSLALGAAGAAGVSAGAVTAASVASYGGTVLSASQTAGLMDKEGQEYQEKILREQKENKVRAFQKDPEDGDKVEYKEYGRQPEAYQSNSRYLDEPEDFELYGSNQQVSQMKPSRLTRTAPRMQQRRQQEYRPQDIDRPDDIDFYKDSDVPEYYEAAAEFAYR